MALEVYIDRVMASQGLARQTALALLRWYIKTCPPDVFEDCVKAIQDIKKLKILWEAGLKPEQQKIVLKRYDELTGGKKGTWILK
ncbi:MAG: hypothetical protein QW734_11480 [Candidatus Bathyarchaeia archaeon]